MAIEIWNNLNFLDSLVFTNAVKHKETPIKGILSVTGKYTLIENNLIT